MQRILGYTVYIAGERSFWKFADQAPPAVQQAILNTPPNCYRYKENDIIIQPARFPIECAQWLVREEPQAKTVFFGRCTPDSPLRPEEDHDKRRRFVVIGYCFSEADAARLTMRHANRRKFIIV